MDEPTSALDELSRTRIMELLCDEAPGSTIVHASRGPGSSASMIARSTLTACWRSRGRLICPKKDDSRRAAAMAMAMGREGEVYGDLMMTRSEISRSPRRVFYDGFQKLLADASFDAFVEETCKPFYAPRRRAIAAAGPLFPHAYDRLFGRAGQRARHCLVLLGLTVAGRFPATRET